MSATLIHPAAVVEKGAELGTGVEIGPFCHIGPAVKLADGVRLAGHVSVTGDTTIGEGTQVQAFAALGGPPQDKKYKGGPTSLVIGANCDIRESVTMHRGTEHGGGCTIVGDGGFYLAYSHVAHDCLVGDNVTLTHGATLGGHCEIGDGVIIGGLSAVHQFVRIGHHAFIGGMAAVVGDVIPYGMAVGNRATLRGFNIVGLKRAGMSRSDLTAMRAAYRMIFAPGHTVGENIGAVQEEFSGSPVVMDIIDFLTSRGKRHFTVPALGDRDDVAGDGGG